MPNFQSIAKTAAYSLEVSPELRRQPVGRIDTKKIFASESSQNLHITENIPANFIYSLNFVETQKSSQPQQFKHGIPLVQRLSLEW